MVEKQSCSKLAARLLFPKVHRRVGQTSIKTANKEWIVLKWLFFNSLFLTDRCLWTSGIIQLCKTANYWKPEGPSCEACLHEAQWLDWWLLFQCMCWSALKQDTESTWWLFEKHIDALSVVNGWMRLLVPLYLKKPYINAVHLKWMPMVSD